MAWLSAPRGVERETKFNFLLRTDVVHSAAAGRAVCPARPSWRRDGGTLVKLVSAAQASRASTWRVCDTAEVNERGDCMDCNGRLIGRMVKKGDFGYFALMTAQPNPDASVQSFFLTFAPYGSAVIAAIVAVFATIRNSQNMKKSIEISKINADRALEAARINAEQAVLVSHTAKIAEFRERWLADLRRDIADFVGTAERVLNKWEEINDLPFSTEEEVIEKDRRRIEEQEKVSNDARVLQWRITLRINPRESDTKADDDAFLETLNELWNPTLFGPPDTGRKAWTAKAQLAIDQGRELLKREWDVTKRFPIMPDLRAPLPRERPKH